MPARSPEEMAAQVDDFLGTARTSLQKLESFRDRLRDDAQFGELWNRDSAEALREMGIDPDARTEVGHPPHSEAPSLGFKSCITPQGNLCLTCPD